MMVRCAASGIAPSQFRELTLGEIVVVLQGYELRRKNSLVDTIVACVRSMAQALGGKNALEGIVDGDAGEVISFAEARRRRFWRATYG